MNIFCSTAILGAKTCDDDVTVLALLLCDEFQQVCSLTKSSLSCHDKFGPPLFCSPRSIYFEIIFGPPSPYISEIYYGPPCMLSTIAEIQKGQVLYGRVSLQGLHGVQISHDSPFQPELATPT